VNCLKTRLAIWIQTRSRQRLAVKVVQQLHHDVQIRVAANRKNRMRQLRSLTIYNSRSQGTLWFLALRRALARFNIAPVPLKISRRAGLDMAVTKIAATYRAYRCAIRVQQGLILVKVQAYVYDAHRKQGMVILLQRVVRILLARGLFLKWHQNLSAIIIEKAIRGFQSRATVSQYRARHLAVIQLQTAVRKRVAVKVHGPNRKWRQLLRIPATLVQASYRRRKSVQQAVNFNKVATLRGEVTVQVHAKLLAYRRVICTELCVESYVSSAEYPGEFQAIFALHCR